MSYHDPALDDMLVCAEPLRLAMARLDDRRSMNIPLMFSRLLRDLPQEERSYVLFFLHFVAAETRH
jgi:hypothetical protein